MFETKLHLDSFIKLWINYFAYEVCRIYHFNVIVFSYFLFHSFIIFYIDSNSSYAFIFIFHIYQFRISRFDFSFIFFSENISLLLKKIYFSSLKRSLFYVHYLCSLFMFIIYVHYLYLYLVYFLLFILFL
jgi:hypothetical protein